MKCRRCNEKAVFVVVEINNTRKDKFRENWAQLVCSDCRIQAEGELREEGHSFITAYIDDT